MKDSAMIALHTALTQLSCVRLEYTLQQICQHMGTDLAAQGLLPPAAAVQACEMVLSDPLDKQDSTSTCV